MFQFPEFASLSLCVQLRIYRHDSVWVFPFRNLRITACVAAPHSLSQLPTSFIASNRLGIHRIPLVACLLLYPETPDFMLMFTTSVNIQNFDIYLQLLSRFFKELKNTKSLNSK